MLTWANELSISSPIAMHELQDQVMKEMAWPLGGKRLLYKVFFLYFCQVHGQLTLLVNHKYGFD